MDFGPKLPYARDRLVECCIWGIAIYFEPKYSLGRRIIIKVLSVASLLDDTYDTHGTLEELQIFTDAVHRFCFYSYFSPLLLIMEAKSFIV